MSKVQEKESTLLNNLSGTEIANELDSRLRDLEKNIPVPRKFPQNQKAIRDASRPRIGPRKNRRFPARMLILFLPRSPLGHIGTQADGAEGLADATRSSPSVLFRRRCKDRYRRHSGP